MKYLNKRGQEDVNVLVEGGQYKLARVYLLGAIDGLWDKNDITDVEAEVAYNILGLDKDEVCRLHQNRALRIS